MGETAWRLVAPSASAASTFCRCAWRSSRILASVKLAVFMEFPTTIPPQGMRYRPVGGTIYKTSNSPKVQTAATPIPAVASGSARGTPTARREEVHPAKPTMTASSSAT